MEIHINKATTFTASPRKLKFEYTDPSQTVDVSIADIASLDDGVRLNTNATVIKVAPGRTVSTGVVQDVTLQDTTGTINLSLWNGNVDILHECNSYNFKVLKVNTYRDNKVLSYTFDSSAVQLEEVIPLIVSNFHDDDTQQTIKGNLVGIQNFEIHVWCIHCESKLKFCNTIAECLKCHLSQRVTYCKYQVTSKLMFRTIEPNHELHLLNTPTEMFLKLLCLLCGEDATLSLDVDKTVLESAGIEDIITITHNGHSVINLTKTD